MHTLKIVGIPGVGKTMLIMKLLKRWPYLSYLSYGEYLKLYGPKNVDAACRIFLSEQQGLVLMDEHLEIGDRDLIDSYREENTCGIFLLEVSPQHLVKRRICDTTRQRDTNEQKIITDHHKSKERAFYLAHALNIPIHSVMDASLDESIRILEEFISRVWGNLI